MNEDRPVERTMKFTDVRQQLSAVVNEVHNEGHRVIIEKNGVAVAALVPAHDLVMLRNADSTRAEAFEAMMRISEAFKDADPSDVEREAARAVSEIRRSRAAAAD